MLINNPKIAKIRELVSEAARYEQLAEECAELTQAALKMARIIRGENITPKTITEVEQNLIEEFSDLMIAAQALKLAPDADIVRTKIDRWIERNSNE